MPSLICPVCSAALRKSENSKSFQCEHNHLFDVSKQGYTNLLLSHLKKSKHPGDTLEMVLARKEFLNRDHYEKISDELNHLAKEYCNKQQPINYSDLGCGEGYYTARLKRSFGNNLMTACGVDISTPAIKSACKRDTSIQWLVSSASHIPIATASQDLASCLFFRFDAHEVARILKTDAILISANTGAKHLIELRQHLYDEVKTDKPEAKSPNESRLAHIKSVNIRQQINLYSQIEIEQLLTMTPHYWRVTQEKKQALSALNQLKVSLDIQFDIYRRTSAL
ncbi:MAG: 23S rRNA (guanine745-N1)-methyltransferase [Pseudohongiellaceae bacterium]|jgi:23S rRNA (guanine745-N1)-methyltransferase